MLRDKEKLKQYCFVTKELAGREVKRKYTRSYLGIMWSVLNPLLTMVIISLIFTRMFNKIIENYPVYYLTGLIIWQFFSNATSHSMTAMVDNRLLLVRVKIPMEVFPLSRILSLTINFLYTFAAYVVVIFMFRIKINVCFIFIIPIFLMLVLFITGISYVLSVLYCFFADIKHLYSVLLTLWMYCSALFYPLSQTPEYMQKLIVINPMYNYITCARKCLMYSMFPNGMEIFRMVFWGVLMFCIGTYVFKKSKGKIMQKI